MPRTFYPYIHDSCPSFSDFNSGHCRLVLYNGTPKKLNTVFEDTFCTFEKISVTEIMLGITEKLHVETVAVLTSCLWGELIFPSLKHHRNQGYYLLCTCMLCFNCTLCTIWYSPLFWCMVIIHDNKIKQRKKPDCTKVRFEPQHVHSFCACVTICKQNHLSSLHTLTN